MLSLMTTRKRSMTTLMIVLFSCMSLVAYGREAKTSTTRSSAISGTRVGGGTQQLVSQGMLKETTAQKLEEGKRLNRRERIEIKKAERDKYISMRKSGLDEVSNTESAKQLRSYRLRKKKTKGLIRKRETTLSQVLFPGVSPNSYTKGESMYILAELVDSKKSPIPFEHYDLPSSCRKPNFATSSKMNLRKMSMNRQNLGSRLQGRDLNPAPYKIEALFDVPCEVVCTKTLNLKDIRKLRMLTERSYRVQLSIDQLPLLMRSKQYNYAARGYPLGFRSAGSYPGIVDSLYLYNHLKFEITYQEDPSSFEGIRITGFDIHPVSYDYGVGIDMKAPTCPIDPMVNDPAHYLSLKMGATEAAKDVAFSYEVKWTKSDLDWTDRWDVYLIGSPDDDIHYFSIVNSLMIVLFLTAAISTIMIRTLRKDIALYNEMQTLEEAQDETGWKLVHGDVFRPPQTSPLILSILVGTGAQIGTASVGVLFCSILHLLNPLKKGQTLTGILFLYVLSGSVAGYTSARLYKFMDGKDWKRVTVGTAVGLPGAFVIIFSILNIFLSFAGAATAVSFFTIVKLFLLWVCVSTPLALVGAYTGFRAEKFDVPTKTNQIARVVPAVPLHLDPRISCFMGGVLPFGSVCIELAFILSALWLHQLYYVMGFLLAVVFILILTCAQVSMVLCYLQLCAEDYRWWWTSFFNTATAGFYLFLYSLWFLISRLDMVGLLPVVVYVTYMGMISFCFALFCGSIGFLSSLFFCKQIYGAVKVD